MQVVRLLVNKIVTGLMLHQVYLPGAVVSVYFSVVLWFRASQKLKVSESVLFPTLEEPMMSQLNSVLQHGTPH